ncbi:hypothetical protein [Bacillus pumilus]|uniref:hypothetical protein n=1 Tax=Bacillus pumilus TaxID=1408 RepID=UPI00119F56C3|nr:hypothetical protein [Bacillus pumilus]
MSINSNQRKQFLLNELKRIGYVASKDKNPAKLSLYELEKLVISLKIERGIRVVNYNARQEEVE